MRSRPLGLIGLGLLLAVTGCAPAVAPPQDTGLGTSALAPSLAPQADHKGRHTKGDKSGPRKTANRKPQPHKAKRPHNAAAPASGPASPAASVSAAPAAGPQALHASVTDPAGDVSGSLTGAPDHVDVTGATLTRDSDRFTLRVSFAGAVPASDSEKTENVAAFYDVDGDGQLDYEIWATLADDGWTGSYRFPDGARFGADSGVTARPDGRELVITFPLAHLRQARAFRWSVGAEWGSYEELAAGATAKDNAPDSGVVAFPG